MARKGILKHDGSGRGIRANKGRGGCKEISEKEELMKTIKAKPLVKKNIDFNKKHQQVIKDIKKSGKKMNLTID